MTSHRMYTEFARLWPQVSSPQEYAEEAEQWREALFDLLQLSPGAPKPCSNVRMMRRICALSSTTRKRRRLKSMRIMQPRQAGLSGPATTTALTVEVPR